jgi:hypothetical protein
MTHPCPGIARSRSQRNRHPRTIQPTERATSGYLLEIHAIETGLEDDINTQEDARILTENEALEAELTPLQQDFQSR